MELLHFLHLTGAAHADAGHGRLTDIWIYYLSPTSRYPSPTGTGI